MCKIIDKTKREEKSRGETRQKRDKNEKRNKRQKREERSRGSPQHTWSPLSGHYTALHPHKGQPGNQLQCFHPLIIRAARPGSGPVPQQHTKLISLEEKRR